MTLSFLSAKFPLMVIQVDLPRINQWQGRFTFINNCVCRTHEPYRKDTSILGWEMAFC